MRLYVATLFCFLAGASLCPARDIYVDNIGGDDRNDGTTERSMSGQGGGPTRTIARALQLADGSDRVIVANTGEPYRESITLQGGRNSGSKYYPFVIVGNGATLEGLAPIPAEGWEHFEDDVFRFKPRFRRHHQVFRDGLPLERAPALGERPSKLEPLQWALAGRFVYVRTEDSRLPQSMNLWHTYLRVGISLYEVRHVEIHDLIVQGYQLDGVNAHDSAFDSALVRVTSRGNGRSGVSVGGSCRVRMRECIVGNNGESQIRTEGFCELDIVNSDVYAEENAPELKRTGGKVRIHYTEAPTAPAEDAPAP